MSNVRLMHENYFDSSFFQAFTYSSQATATPASNVLASVRRSKPWRSAGYWEITAANKGIVLQEVAAVNQTVNIAEGVYTSDTAFFAAVKVALDAAPSTAVYTVTRDTTTQKIKITSDGAGGAIFRLMCTNVAFTAASTLGFSTGADLTGALTYTADTLKIHTSEWLKLDAGTSVNPKAFVLVGSRGGGVLISPTATITLQGNSTDSWTSPAYSQVLTYDESAIVLTSATGLHTSALRFWRILIVDTSNPLGYVEINSVYLGDVITTTQGAVEFPLDITEVDTSRVEYGYAGTAFADENEATSTIRFGWNLLTSTEAEALIAFRREVGKSKPFFIGLDPDAVFSSSENFRTYMVRFTDDVNFSLFSPGVFSSDWSLREEI